MAHLATYDSNEHYDSGLRWDQLVLDHQQKVKKTMASSDFIPHARGDYRAWLLNLKTRIPAIGATLGLAGGVITAIQAACTAQIALIDAITAAETALQGAQEAETTGRTTTDATLRDAIGDWKRLGAWTNEIAAELQAVGTATPFDPTAYKPGFKASIQAGEIRLDFKKKGVDGVAVYARLAGQTTWSRIGTDTSSPYIDGRELASAGVAETREYMLRGMIKDDEIGLDSDVARIAWAGA
jgi:hypothetical protein